MEIYNDFSFPPFFLFIFLILLNCFLLLPVSNIYATEIYFQDDFNSLSETDWIINSSKSSEELIENGKLKLEGEGAGFPYVCRELNLPENVDFELEIKFKYEKIDDWGVGINIGNSILDYTVSQSYYATNYNDAEYTHFQIWQDSSSPIYKNKLLLKNHPTLKEEISDAEFYYLSTGNDFNSHVFKLSKVLDDYFTYLDGNKLSVENLSSTREVEYICFGNPTEMDSSDLWSAISVDYIEVSIDINSEKNKVIFLPGLSASWNSRAMVLGHDEVSWQEWDLIPFAVPVYKRFRESMALNGYQEGVDFFVWPYNWTQSIELSSEDLKEYIDGLNLESGEKVDLVGHSLGGMVSRDFAQDYPELVDKVITVGSPHQGAVQAYQALAGGKIGEQRDLEWIGMQLLVHLNRRGFQTNADVVKDMAEVLNDLTPTFDYLNKDNSYLQTHAYSNQYLNVLNTDPGTNLFIDQADFFAGNMADSTPLELKLGGTNIVDRLLGLWPDGKPLKTIFGIGDETVLRLSSYLGTEPNYEYPLEHKELINEDEPLTQILKSLGINSPQLAGENNIPSADDMLIFYLASPAELQIENIGTGETYVPQNPNIQMVYLNYPENAEEYTAELFGTGDGQYHLYVGQLTPQGSFWRSYGGEISSGDEKYYNFEIDANRPEADPLSDQTGKKFLDQALFKLEELNSQDNQHLNSGQVNLETAITNVKNEKWNEAIAKIDKTIANLSGYRKGLGENEIIDYNLSLEISQLLISSWQKINLYHQEINQQEAVEAFRSGFGSYNLGLNYLQLANQRGQEINKFKVMSLKRAESVVDEIFPHLNESKYGLIYPHSYLIKTLSREAYIKDNPFRNQPFKSQ